MKLSILEIQEQLNNDLGKVLSDNGINKLSLINIGNSIASGFSLRRLTKPLFLRDESLKDILKKYGVDLKYHHFARAQNNNDEHFFEWLVCNVKESNIASMNRNDYLSGKTSMNPLGISEKEIYDYFPSKVDKDYRIMDLIRASNHNMANIVVYNGCTGSFLDSNMRAGNFFQKFFYGIRRDSSSIDAILKAIQTSNRLNGSNTQVFLCGVPNLLGINISDAMNLRLRNKANKYANVVYVPPVVAKVFYNPLNAKSKDEKEADVHYDEEEYLLFLNNIIKSINDNYLINKAMIDLDRKLYNFSRNLEFVNQNVIDDKEYIDEYVSSVLEKETKKMNKDQIREFYKKAKKYLLERYPFDFYYVGKDNIRNTMINGLKKVKK